MNKQRILPWITALALLALQGCATESRTLQAIGFPPAAGAISDDEARAVTEQIVALRKRREELRVQLSRENDPDKRAWYYRDIATVSADLMPLQKRLQLASRPLP